jgi:small-conductance mechanosensitive channel
MSNLLAALYSRSKFQIGDDVKIGGVRGTVIEMDSTSITLATSDRRVVIPLNHLTQEQVEIFGNWNENPRIED